MNHSEIQNEEIIERYVRNQLSAEERRVFQEHFFTCDDCFSQVQMTERFINGVRHAVESGLVADRIIPRETEVSSRWFRWVKPAFAITMAATLVLSAVIAWLFVVRIPALRGEIQAQRKAREEIEQQKQRQIDELNARLQEEQSRQLGREEAALVPGEHKPEQPGRSTNSSSRRSAGAEATELLAKNIPVVTLQPTRAAQDMNEIELPATARRFALFIEIAPHSRFKSFRLEVLTPTGSLVSSASNLLLNKQNAVVAILQAEPFASGDYLVKLYGGSQGQTRLVGEYKLRLNKK